MSAARDSGRRARPLARRLCARLSRLPVSAGIADPAVFLQRFHPGGVSAERLHARMVPHAVGQFGAVGRARHQPDRSASTAAAGATLCGITIAYMDLYGRSPLAATISAHRPPADPDPRRHRRHLAADPGQSRRLRPVAHGDRARPHTGGAADHGGDHAQPLRRHPQDHSRGGARSRRARLDRRSAG